MRKKLCKILSLFLSMIMLLGVIFSLPATVSAADASGNIYPSTLDGECGEDAHFYCFPDASMAVFGNGPMYDYELSANNVSTAPWYRQLDHLQVTLFVNKIAIEYGITSIGDYSFYFPDTVYKQDSAGNDLTGQEVDTAETTTYAFYKTIAQLYNVDIAYTVTRIGKYAFYNQKMEHITIPGEVTHIGENAFLKSSLKDIIYYGNPNSLTWDGGAEFTNRITVYVPSTYASVINSEYVTDLAERKNITFSATIGNPYDNIESLDRSIGAYFGSTNSKVFGGAAPFIIVGSFNGVKKSTTYGSAGYVSCVKDNSGNYYVLTDSSTGELSLATVNGISGKMEGYTTAHSSLKLKITPQYVGPDIVKMVYTLENNSNTAISGIQLGGTGDIKIGADDYAALEPLMEDPDGEGELPADQVGIYMRSRDTDYDMVMVDGTPQYATFGFIGENVKKDQNDALSEKYPDAKFFYGAVGTTTTYSATGTKSMILIPERIFNMNSGKSVESGDFNRTHTADSGLSYYWDGVTVPAKSGDTPGTAQFAVMFSVYGVKSNAAANSTAAPDPAVEGASAVTAVSDSKKAESEFLTVTWMNPSYTFDTTTVPEATLSTQVVKSGEIPVYTGATPKRDGGPSDNTLYVFDGWSTSPDGAAAPLTAITANAIYYAHYNSRSKDRLFQGHSLSLNGDIGVNFYLKKSEIEQAENGTTVRVDFTRTVMGEDKKDSVTLTVDNEADQRIASINGGESQKYYVATCRVPAAEMSYNIHATAYYSSTNSYHWDKDNYSVRQYGMEIINSDAGTYGEKHDQLVTLAKEMLNYGAKAQILFNRLDAPLANVSVTGYSMPGDIDTSDFDTAIANEAKNIDAGVTSWSNMETYPDDFGLTYGGSSVVFLSETSLRHYYSLNAGYDLPDYEIFNYKTNEWETKTFLKNAPTDTYYYAEIPDIPAAEIDVLQQLKIKDTIYYYSALDYAWLLFKQGNETEQNLGLATFLYNRAANSYFQSQEAA